MNTKNTFFRQGCSLPVYFSVLLDVVEAEGEDLDDDLKKDFGPRLFFRFLFHKSLNVFPHGRFVRRAIWRLIIVR